jgi:hypothetical protein
LTRGFTASTRTNQKIGIPVKAAMKRSNGKEKNNKQTQVAMSLMTGKKERSVLTRTGHLFLLFFIFFL